MRLTYGLIIGLAVFAAAGRAAALSCYTPTDVDEQGSPLDSTELQVPIDAQPWRVVDCLDSELIACTLALAPLGVDEPETQLDAGFPVAVERDGVAACALDELDESHSSYVRRFIPSEPLEPDSIYRLACTGNNYMYLTTRADSKPSAPPVAPVITDAHLTRGDDDGCCGGGGDIVELRLADMSPPYIEEGGYLEVAYANGYRRALGRTDEDHHALLPTDDDLVLTPVAADGTRGSPVELSVDDIDSDLVYIPCNVAGRSASGGVWLLGAFMWIFAAGRRQRRAS